MDVVTYFVGAVTFCIDAILGAVIALTGAAVGRQNKKGEDNE